MSPVRPFQQVLPLNAFSMRHPLVAGEDVYATFAPGTLDPGALRIKLELYLFGANHGIRRHWEQSRSDATASAAIGPLVGSVDESWAAVAVDRSPDPRAREAALVKHLRRIRRIQPTPVDAGTRFEISEDAGESNLARQAQQLILQIQELSRNR